MTAHMAFPVPTATHIDRTRCGRCGNWYWAGDAHQCPVPGPTNADVLDAAFPDHPMVGIHMRPVDCPPGCECRTWKQPDDVTTLVLPRRAA